MRANESKSNYFNAKLSNTDMRKLDYLAKVLRLNRSETFRIILENEHKSISNVIKKIKI
jgi:hypothetical protein